MVPGDAEGALSPPARRVPTEGKGAALGHGTTGNRGEAAHELHADGALGMRSPCVSDDLVLLL